MQRWVAAMVALGLSVSCGDNAPGFEIYVYAQPSLARYRAGGGSWQTPALIASDQGWQTYVLDDVVADYELEVVCFDSQITYDVQLDATVDDGAQNLQPGLIHYCGPNPPAQTTAEVRGTTTSAAEVTIDGYRDRNYDPGHFAIQAPQGADDLIANDDANVEIVRGLSITADMTLPELDLEADGAPYDEITLDVQGAKLTAVDSLHVSLGASSLSTNHGSASLGLYSGEPGQVTGTFRIAPASQRSADDISEVDWNVLAANAGASVMIDGTASPGPAPVAIAVPSVDGVEVELGADNAVTWTGLPNQDYSSLDFYAYGRCVPLQRTITATRRFLDLGHTVSFTSSTQVDRTAPIQMSVTTSRSYDGYTTTASTSTTASIEPTGLFSLPPCTPNRAP